MRTLIRLITGLGDSLVSMSPRTRMRLVVLGLVLLGGSSGHKLYVSLTDLAKPRPAASADAIILPMESLFEQTKGQVNHYQTTQQKRQRHLDSLAEQINPDLTPSTR